MALEWAYGPWPVNAIGMNIGENGDCNIFDFWGAQAGYRSETSIGMGNYRLILGGTSSAFVNPTGTDKDKRLAWGLSFDQELGDIVRAFLRLAWQKDDAVVDYKAPYSGGLDFSGSGWSREPDNVGLGYAYLDGGDLDLKRTHVFEGSPTAPGRQRRSSAG